MVAGYYQQEDELLKNASLKILCRTVVQVESALLFQEYLLINSIYKPLETALGKLSFLDTDTCI